MTLFIKYRYTGRYLLISLFLLAFSTSGFANKGLNTSPELHATAQDTLPVPKDSLSAQQDTIPTPQETTPTPKSGIPANSDTIQNQKDISPGQTNGDSITVSGVVANAENGELVPGVTIRIKGTNKGVTTDKDGYYTISLTDKGKTLIFSFLGYKDKKVPVNGRTGIDVELEKGVIKSEKDLVVIGYGSRRQEDLTGAISSINKDEIDRQTVSSVDQLLQGHVAGVQVTQNSGAPGGGSTVRIRGINSIQAGNNPLYVIDGLPVGGGSSPSQNPLSLINPQDIISIDVLKDASATAIYGSRGANGVVLVTTNKGGGSTQVNFETKVGFNQVRNKLDLVNSQQYMTLANEAVTNNNNEDSNPNNDEPLVFPNAAGNYPNTDWQDEVFRSAPQQSYQLSVSGGDEDTRYALSANFYNEKGILIGSDYKRGSFRINFEKDVNDKFTVGNNLIVSQANYGLIETGGRGLSGIVNGALQIPSVVPVKDQNGNYVFQTNEVPIKRANPVASALEKTDENKRFKSLGSLYASYMITDGLEAKVSIGGDLNYRKSNFYAPRTTLQGQENNGRASVAANRSFTWINENTLTYEKNFLEKHTINLLGGFTLQRTTGENLRGASTNFITDAFTYNNLNAGSVPDNPASGASNSSLVSYIGRADYNYDDRYILTLTGRADGSSRFGTGNKYGFFPSGALAWRVSNESFMEPLDAISNLKLRLSYGITGNQEIGNYAALTQLGNSQVTFGDHIVVGINPSTLGNKNLKWERTTQYNAGVDLGLIDNRISVTGDVYYKKTTDLLLTRRVPRYTGYSSYLDNIGSTQNRGLELALKTKNIAKKEFQWNSSINFSVNRNKVLELSDGEPLYVGAPISFAGSQNFRVIKEGKSLGTFYGYTYGGVYRNQKQINKSAVAITKCPDDKSNCKQLTRPGDPYLIDIDGPKGEGPDGKIGDADKSIIGNAFPNFTYGFTNNFFYKGFDLNIFIEGSQGNDILNMNTLRLESLRGYTNQTADVLNRWTQDHTNIDIPRADRSRNNTSKKAMRSISSRLIEDGSYIRLKNLTLGYTLPVDWTQSFGTHSVRFYVSALNLVTVTNYSGYDPEVSTYNNLGNFGADYGTYPRAKTYLMGIKLGF